MGSNSTPLPDPDRRRRRGFGSTIADPAPFDSLPATQAVSLESTSMSENRSRAFGPEPSRRAPSSSACAYTHETSTPR
jgi:hypothetical protein